MNYEKEWKSFTRHIKNYSNEEKEQYIKEFKRSKLYPNEFAKAKGLLVSEFKNWLREDSYKLSNKSKTADADFGIINLNIAEANDVTTLGLKSTNGFKFENATIKIELKEGYDKALLRTLFGVLVG